MSRAGRWIALSLLGLLASIGCAPPDAEEVVGQSAALWSGQWAARAELTEATPATGRRFGTAVALAAETAAVGAPYTSQPSVSFYSRSGGSYQAILRRTGTAGAATGRAVATAEGRFAYGAIDPATGWRRAIASERLVTGWIHRTVETDTDAGLGKALAMAGSRLMILEGGIHRRTSSGPWEAEEHVVVRDLDAPYNGSEDHAAVATDGETAVRGAVDGVYFPGGATRIGPGRAYVGTRYGNVWLWDKFLTGPTREVAGGQPSARFGRAVAVQGDRIVVLSEREFDSIGTALPGATYVFQRAGSSWQQEARFTYDAWLEPSVALDGSRIVVATTDRVAGAYTVHVHEKVRFGWQKTTIAQPSPVKAVALAGDELLVGMPERTVGGLSFAGAVRPYFWQPPVASP